MATLISTVLIGGLISILGIINMRGNISSLHWYHRHRVVECDRKPFSMMIGLGTLIVGLSCIVFGITFAVSEITNVTLLTVIGAVLLIIGIVAGIGISLYAMIKYNKGIF